MKTKSNVKEKKVSLVFGVGLYDLNEPTAKIINGKRVDDPYYRKWRDMLKRCYSDKYQDKSPTYVGCSVCEEWLTFSNFKEWMEKQKWEGKQLDKDIIKEGNKIYSPENCMFVEKYINVLFLDSASNRGDCPIGVSIDKRAKIKKYTAQIRKYGKSHFLGYYATAEEASLVYQRAKFEYVKEIAQNLNPEDEDPRLIPSLKRWLINKRDELNNTNTIS